MNKQLQVFTINTNREASYIRMLAEMLTAPNKLNNKLDMTHYEFFAKPFGFPFIKKTHY